jgi:hypothetical protein
VIHDRCDESVQIYMAKIANFAEQTNLYIFPCFCLVTIT